MIKKCCVGFFLIIIFLFGLSCSVIDIEKQTKVSKGDLNIVDIEEVIRDKNSQKPDAQEKIFTTQIKEISKVEQSTFGPMPVGNVGQNVNIKSKSKKST